jgi:hypothetical protein
VEVSIPDYYFGRGILGDNPDTTRLQKSIGEKIQSRDNNFLCFIEFHCRVYGCKYTVNNPEMVNINKKGR